jgi:amino acid transporter
MSSAVAPLTRIRCSTRVRAERSTAGMRRPRPPERSRNLSENLSTQTSDSTRLKLGALGVPGITFMVLSAAAPLSLIAGYGPLGILVGGAGAPAGYLIAGVVLALFAVGFTTMARRLDVAGTFYAYIQRGFGRRAGRGAAAGALFAYLVVQVGGVGVFAVSAQSTIADFFGLNVHWLVIGIVMVIVVWAIGRRGIDVSARLLGVLLILESVLLLALAVAVVIKGGGPGGLTGEAFRPANVFSPGMAAACVVWFGAFMGIESTAIYRSEARTPLRTIPRATYLSIALLAAFYTFVSWALMQAFGTAGAIEAASEHPEDMVYIAADTFLGGWSGPLLRILMLASTLTSGLAFYNAINRYGHSLALDGTLPARFAEVHPVHRSPKVGSLQAVITLVIVIGFAAAQLDPYAQMVVWTSTPGVIGIVTLLSATSAAAAVYLWRPQEGVNARMALVAVSTIASALLAGVVYQMIDNVALMTNTDSVWTNTLCSVIPFAVIITAALASRTARRRNNHTPTTDDVPDIDSGSAPTARTSLVID